MQGVIGETTTITNDTWVVHVRLKTLGCQYTLDDKLEFQLPVKLKNYMPYLERRLRQVWSDVIVPDVSKIVCPDLPYWVRTDYLVFTCINPWPLS